MSNAHRASFTDVSPMFAAFQVVPELPFVPEPHAAHAAMDRVILPNRDPRLRQSKRQWHGAYRRRSLTPRSNAICDLCHGRRGSRRPRKVERQGAARRLAGREGAGSAVVLLFSPYSVLVALLTSLVMSLLRMPPSPVALNSTCESRTTATHLSALQAQHNSDIFKQSCNNRR